MEQNILEQIAELRHENYSYQFIADTLGMPMNTVKSICRRQGFSADGPRKTKAEKAKATFCKCCLKPLSNDTRKDKRFCSEHCRTVWRRTHLTVSLKTP